MFIVFSILWSAVVFAEPVDYGNGVYFFHSACTQDYRDDFGRTLAELIKKKNNEGYELVALTAIDKDRGYWVIFRKK